MCGTPESGHCMCMFHSGSKYYIWDPIEGAIWEIVTEMDLVDIVTEMGKPRSLKTEKVPRDVNFRLILGLENATDKLL